MHELQREAATETADILRCPNPVAAVEAREREFIRIRRFRRRTIVVGHRVVDAPNQTIKLLGRLVLMPQDESVASSP